MGVWWGVFFRFNQLQVQRQRWFVVEGKEKATAATHLFFPPPQTTARGKTARYFQRKTGAALPCKNGTVGLMELRRCQ
ncbi:hypothetical protein A6M27_16130 [Acidithiobacillus thiooxidans]|uniref:Uncharacterized protein n=1 Tax=Acidithiobacillus thiooxidans TaxID=930 RepID=A0A1C2J832_ACITH|nr:hypothetical protein A6P07_03075 [Acidithiobacillus thiooxidans]OCX79112.1 hypothetical protein A6O24_02680 [Acidithiobacillus thiooxidans]OCX84384.1 hypothetical protein A6M27_16130 [Acidithiobacillus thiooxidans]OCX84998.1 hypothetical protein A6O26_02835 [Acidithiobacillus thiooxidans]OFC41553.1 hypothetical protein BAE47_17685 [Acidithiobacillus thiooxidans]